MPLLTKTDLRRLIPHHGAMCLLDAVERWDATSIVCTTASHRDATNPLRRGGELEAICGLEYAAQAMAAHVGLDAGKKRPVAVGYLGAVKHLMLRATRLDDVKEHLTIEATRLVGEGGRFIYTFRVSASGQDLLAGRASIFVSYRDDPS
jgi:predicted hotdog family 3-hydroxylacyl-ACP dehydratase